jgi:hypothetical protein
MGDLTVASTRLASLDRVDLDALPTKRRVVGEDVKWVVFIIPIGIPHLEDAVEAALDAGGGDVLTDATIHQVSWWFLFGQIGYRVIGDVVDTRQRPPEASP